MIKDKTQIIVFTKRNEKWEPELWKSSAEDTVNLEKILEQRRNDENDTLEDFKIWLQDEIGENRYWDDLNFYETSNFIYLPITSPVRGPWGWFNMEENIPKPNYKTLSIIQEDFSFEENILLMDNESLNTMIKFVSNLAEGVDFACCNLNACSIPYTILAWKESNLTYRVQVWGYEPVQLFENENGMNLILDDELNFIGFYQHIENAIKMKEDENITAISERQKIEEDNLKKNFKNLNTLISNSKNGHYLTLAKNLIK